ncbi:hypothetical protein Nepgr_018319 [Nepenthes gracilis]|uniref:RRM domain-containing protein n=1 Tax=Nepenthes gracilis TaxID=150966 RepID=A0AAD3SS12_NEPGR|nr:hypothetical protein Nepgr_018319 [Nepenthes gracilis]
MVDFELGKLFVGGISWETNEDILKDHFAQYGNVLSSVIAKDRITGSPRGFGFVTFSDPFSAGRALDDRHVILGRTVEVKKAIPRTEQQQNSHKQDHQHSQQQSSRALSRNSNGNCGGSNTDHQFRTKKIFVGGLSANLTEEEFKSYFERFGRIKDVVVMHDNTTNRPRGFGFITFDSEEVVENIMQNNFHKVGGKLVEVKRAVPKEASRNGYGGCSPRVGGGGGKVSSFDGYHRENYHPCSPRYEIYPGQAPYPMYGGAGGYYYGGIYAGGYPMGGCNAMGYGFPWTPGNPWNGFGMLGFGPVPYAATAVYSAGSNIGIDVMGVASTCNRTGDSGATEKSNLDVSGHDQVLDNAAAPQI